MAAIIEFQDIAKKYGEKTIMEHFNLSVEEEEFLTIIGSSGCGKTTMLKMVNGLISPDEGNVRVWKEDVAKTDQIKLRRSIGYSIQGNVLFPHMTVEENISYVPDLLNRRDKKKTREAVAKWMEIVGLSDDMRNRFPSELSGGQQQRVGIARALAASPEILLMDEPFGAVDEITRSQLQKEIKRIHQKTGVTILFVTHDIGEALYLGTKVLVLDHGEIQQYGTPEEIKKHPSNEFVKKLLYNRQDKYGEAAIG
nr:ABC transporter ATP-binding protein [uncultured Anaerostipes sp.]